MNNARLFFRLLIVAAAMFSLAKIEAMQPKNNKDSIYRTHDYNYPGHEMMYFKGSMTIVAHMSGLPPVLIGVINAMMDAAAKIVAYNEEDLKRKKGEDLGKGMALYALIDTANRYAFDFAYDKMVSFLPSMPTSIAQRFAIFPQSIQTAGATMCKNCFVPVALDKFTRHLLFRIFHPAGVLAGFGLKR